MLSPLDVERLKRIVAVARGDEPADLVLRGGEVLNVFTGEVVNADVALCGDTVAGVGEYHGTREIDLDGAVVLPGFIEGHIHIESSFLCPTEFAAAVSAHGTTTVIADPHEIANVAGLAGVQYMLSAAQGGALARGAAPTGEPPGGPVDIFLMAPSCVPATALETAGAELGPDEVEQMLGWPGVLGLAEMMNFPGVLSGQNDVMLKLAAAAGRPIDGHAPGLSGSDLQAYLAAGPRSEHEATSLAEAQEKLAAGAWVMIRHGSAAQNLRDLAPLLAGEGASRCLLVCDDRNPVDLLERGHLDECLRLAVAAGVPAHRAVRAVTINAATRFGLTDRGAIAPGLRADLVVVEDLRDFQVQAVYKDGHIVAGGSPTPRRAPRRAEASRRSSAAMIPEALRSTCHLPPWSPETLRIPVSAGDGEPVRVRVIEIVPGQVLTRAGEAAIPAQDGELMARPDDDLLKLAVIERHRGTGNVGLGFVRGFDLKRGALASSVAHDSHNLVVVGATDTAMRRAAEAVAQVGGGQAVATDDEVLAILPLPIAGLMSDRPLAEVAGMMRGLHKAASKLGCRLNDPFMTLSFLALPVIPELKLTDRGLVDVSAFDFVALIIA